MDCESCGSKMEQNDSYLVFIEGAKLNVCFRCKRLGKPVHTQRPSNSQGRNYPQNSPSTNQRPSLRMEFELAENYGSIIKNAREAMGLPLNVLAEKISEKESFLDRIEKQKTRPPIPVAKKLEKELNITLLEDASDSSATEKNDFKKSSSVGLTLGDILELEKRKKK